MRRQIPFPWAAVLIAIFASAAYAARGGETNSASDRGASQEKQCVKLLDKAPAEYTIEMHGALDSFNSAYYDVAAGLNLVELSAFQPNVELRIENVGDHDVVNPRVIINDRHDWFSLDTLVAEVCKPGMSDAEKAMAVFEVFRDNLYHQYGRDMYVEAGVAMSDLYDPIKHLNCYENTGCGCVNLDMVTTWKHAGLDARLVRFGMGHTVCEVFYDGAWHMMDADMKVFHLNRDNKTIASIAQCKANRRLVQRSIHYGVAAREDVKYYYGNPSGGPLEARQGHTMAITLRPGEAIVRCWDNVGKFHCFAEETDSLAKYANGKIVYKPDLSKGYVLRGAERHYGIKLFAEDGKRPYVHASHAPCVSELIYRVKSPYCIVGGRIRAEFPAKKGGRWPRVYVSLDGRDWRKLWEGPIYESSACDVSIDGFIAPQRRWATYEYFVKFEFECLKRPTDIGIDSLAIETDVQMAIPSLPALRLGRNKVVYRDDGEGPRRVKITHDWRERSANRPPEAPAAALAPADGSESESTAPLLRWEAAKDADGDAIKDHHVELRARADMRFSLSPSLDRITFSDKPQWQVPESFLNPDQRYYWHVRARDKRGAWSGWSKTWSFVAKETKETTK